MKGPSTSHVLLLLLLAHLGLVGPAASQGFTRWGNFGLSAEAGSFRIGIDKRLSQAGLEEIMCKPCAHYAEAWVEFDEVDDGPINRDVDTFALGYRYYVVTGDRDPRRKERLAVFLRAGLTRAELERGDTRSGYYGGLGLEYPITQSIFPKDHPRSGELRPFWISALGTVSQNEIERPGSNLDYVSVRFGVRFVFPSRRDQRRADCLYGRRHEVGEKLTVELLRQAGAEDLPTEGELGELSVQDRLDRFPREVEKLFKSGDLARPESCYEPYS